MGSVNKCNPWVIHTLLRDGPGDETSSFSILVVAFRSLPIASHSRFDHLSATFAPHGTNIATGRGFFVVARREPACIELDEDEVSLVYDGDFRFRELLRAFEVDEDVSATEEAKSDAASVGSGERRSSIIRHGRS